MDAAYTSKLTLRDLIIVKILNERYRLNCRGGYNSGHNLELPSDSRWDSKVRRGFSQFLWENTGRLPLLGHGCSFQIFSTASFLTSSTILCYVVQIETAV
jgi:hypothetical protein